MDVSILVLIFNPNLEKLKATIKSVVCQKNVSFEVIIADDGSQVDSEDYVNELMKSLAFSNYTYLRSDVNQGTVRNYYDATNVSKGKYIYAISPGDMIFDEYTISDFYEYAESKRCKLCFGNAIYYQDNDSHTILNNHINLPPKPQVFDGTRSALTEKTALFFGSIILGVTFFRERETTIHYLDIIKDYVKYAEDNTIAFLYVCDGNRIRYYDRNIAWYEYGTGVSTQKQTKWNKILMQDYDNIYKYLKNNYKDDDVVDAAYFDRFSKKPYSLLYRIIKHPRIFAINCRIKKLQSKHINNDKQILLDKMFV